MKKQKYPDQKKKKTNPRKVNTARLLTIPCFNFTMKQY